VATHRAQVSEHLQVVHVAHRPSARDAGAIDLQQQERILDQGRTTESNSLYMLVLSRVRESALQLVYQ